LSRVIARGDVVWLLTDGSGAGRLVEMDVLPRDSGPQEGVDLVV
jgi:hypothetical protein